MGTIRLNKIKLYAFHGCLEEEARIGAEYEVEVSMDCDFSAAANSDNLLETIDYVTIFQLVKTEMAIRSKLLEHVAQRIVQAILNRYKQIDKLSVIVAKLNPPMNGNVESVSVQIDA